MSSFTERAWPKVNLTLRVLGRRSDGYHEIESLVAFARDVADRITLRPGPGEPHVTSSGPFAAGIAGTNLIAVALARAARTEPRLILGGVDLEKNIPVAAGIGGGSADAAAVLRAVRAANPGLAASVDWHAISASLGADVPVCLDPRPQVMRGIGDQLATLPALPELAAVLVNPLLSVPLDKTAQVFRRLGAARLVTPSPARRTPAHFADRASLLDHIRRTANDLLAPARLVVPAIDIVLAALEAAPGCELAQLSGGGPTCFGLFCDSAAAEVATRSLRASHPQMWIVPSRLG